jgi:hypothetical protein
MRFCFVSTRHGSRFMTELLIAVAAATESAGHATELVFDRFPSTREDCVYVVIPHEFHAWGNPGGFPGRSQRERTIALCTENPGTEWFEATCELVPEFATAVSINRSSAAELRRRGIRCAHLQLGYVPQWDTWSGDPVAKRPLDVLYLGAADPRRDLLLAGMGKELSTRSCELLIPPLEPRTTPRPDFLVGAEKYHRLRSAKILLNLHRTTSASLEWMRFIEAICNGCVVVSEPCLDSQPLIPGQHFEQASAERIARAVNGLLDDPDRLGRLQSQAYEFIRGELPMQPAGERLAEIASELPFATPSANGDSFAHTHKAAPTPRVPEPQRQRRELAARTRQGWVGSLADRARDRLHGPTVTATTPSYLGFAPRVSALVVHAPGESLESPTGVAEAFNGDLELLVLDLQSEDRPTPLEGFIRERPWLPAMLLREPPGRGRSRSLNALARRARGDYVFVLGAGGGMYASAPERLAARLDADPDAFFCYPMTAALDGDRPTQLLGSMPWEPQRLKRGNWIDDTVLLRRERLLALGGYCTDARLAGWESFELWCRCAEAGWHGTHVAQVLAWRPAAVVPGTPEMWALMRDRFPDLLGEEANT